MGLTNFPDGINVGSGADYPLRADADVKVAYGTVTVPSGASGTAFASGLTTVSYVTASPYSTVVTVAGYAGVVVSASGGSVTFIGVSGAGTVSTASGTATWIAIGT